MLIQHVKGYPDPSMYSKNKGGITCDTDRETPCILGSVGIKFQENKGRTNMVQRN